MRRHSIVALAAALLVSGCTRSSSAIPADWQPSLEQLASPAGGDSTAPQLTSTGNRTFMSWLEATASGTALKFAERTTAGWSAPLTVVSGENLIVNFADVPSVRLLADGTFAAHWLEENGPDPEASTLRVAWSRDGGQTWSRAVSPHDDTRQTQHGFAALFPAPDGGLGVVWLDGRGLEESGNMALRAATFGRDGVKGGETEIDPRACECCPTAAATTSDGVLVAYRDRTPGEIRDIAVTRLEGDRWTAPTIVHADNWEIEGCPVNGPAISARNRDVVVAWFTADGDEGRSLAAFSRDAGRTFGEPVRLDEGSALGRAGVELLDDGSAIVTWMDFSGGRAQLTIRRIGQDGSRGPAVNVANVTGTQFPRLARGTTGELLLAWTEGTDGSQRVRTARMLVGR